MSNLRAEISIIGGSFCAFLSFVFLAWLASLPASEVPLSLIYRSWPKILGYSFASFIFSAVVFYYSSGKYKMIFGYIFFTYGFFAIFRSIWNLLDIHFENVSETKMLPIYTFQMGLSMFLLFLGALLVRII
ncbi:hypothetical protein HYY75_07925 [bacterium]|nr:hypothetical protein [bacterium]